MSARGVALLALASSLAGCNASHATLDASDDAPSDGGLGLDGAYGPCSVEGAVECSGIGEGRECRGGVWWRIVDGPCWPPPDAGVEPDAGVCISDSAAVPIESTATVHLAVRGTGWVVERGFGCSPYGITNVDTGSGVTLGIPFQCPCECPAPPPPGPEALLAVGGAPVSVTWDARQITTWTQCVDCAARGWPGAGWTRETVGAPQPVLPGRYRIAIAVYDELPIGCSDAGDGTASCGFGGGGPPTLPFRFGACEGTRTVEVEVDVPERGEVTVEIDTSLPTP